MVRSECPPEDHMFEELVWAGGTLGGCCRSFERSAWLSEVCWGFSILIHQDAFWGAQQVPTTSAVGGVVCSCHHSWNPPLGTPFTKMDCIPMKLCVRLCVSFLKVLLSGIFSQGVIKYIALYHNFKMQFSLSYYILHKFYFNFWQKAPLSCFLPSAQYVHL